MHLLVQACSNIQKKWTKLGGKYTSPHIQSQVQTLVANAKWDKAEKELALRYHATDYDQLKVSTIGNKSIFLKIAGDNFTSFYRPMIPLMNKLRKKILGETWRTENLGMYRTMKEIFVDGQSDSAVL